MKISENQRSVFIQYWTDIVQRYFASDIAQIIVSQFALESNFGTSVVFQENNNLCGMKKPVYRFTTSKPNPHLCCSSYAYYDTPLECFYDYMLWLCYNKITQRYTPFSFLRALSNIGYAEDKDYISKILTIKQKYYGE